MLFNIYSISSRYGEVVYIGSTSKTIQWRFSSHKHFFNKYLMNNGPYCSSYEVLLFDDAEISLVLTIEGSKMDARKAEQDIMNTINPTLLCNYNKAYLSKEEMIIKNRELSKENYLLKNDFITRPIICPCGITYQRHNQTNHFRTKQHKNNINVQITNNNNDNFIMVYSND